MPTPRSYLFVPGNRPDRFPKAATSGADRIIIDLEDAVGPGEKDAARGHAAEWFGNGGAGVVRINGAETPWFTADLQAAANWTNAEIMVPKASVASLSAVGNALAGRPLIALIESVEGLVELREIARRPEVVRLAFGNLDFGVDARIPGTGPVLDPARFEIAIASRLGDLQPPIDGVTTEIGNADVLAAEISRARALGFAAKLCIHPQQVGAVNEGFSPSAEERAWAEKIMAAIETSDGGVIRVDGKMVDRPVIEKAKAILASAG